MSPPSNSLHLGGASRDKRNLGAYTSAAISGVAGLPQSAGLSSSSVAAATSQDDRRNSMARRNKSGARAVFDRYDLDGSGAISVTEFRRLCYDMGYFLSDRELALDVKILDVDGDGEISYDEFIQWWKKDDRFKSLQMADEHYDQLAVYLADFKKFDKDGSGIIDVREFKALYTNLAKKHLTTKSLMGTLQELDMNKDGKVSFNEYVTWALKHSIPEPQQQPIEPQV